MGIYHFHQLQKCIKKQGQYLFPIKRDNLKAKAENFKTSIKYQQWKSLLQYFYNTFSNVEH